MASRSSRSSASCGAAGRSPSAWLRRSKTSTNYDIPTGALDITLYRDDLMRTAIAAQPVIRRTETPFSIDDRRILLVDDVRYTGRTIRAAALDALIEFGRPEGDSARRLVDRGTASCPSLPDYVGKNPSTSLTQSVQVHLTEIDGRDEVEIPQSAKKDLLSIDDPTSEERFDLILDTSEGMREIGKRHDQESPDTCAGKTIVNLFLETSTRTRTCFGFAAKRLRADIAEHRRRDLAAC